MVHGGYFRCRILVWLAWDSIGFSIYLYKSLMCVSGPAPAAQAQQGHWAAEVFSGIQGDPALRDPKEKAGSGIYSKDPDFRYASSLVLS